MSYQQLTELVARIRNERLSSLFVRIFDEVRGLLITPWHVLYWIPLTAADRPLTRLGSELCVVKSVGDLCPAKQKALERSIGVSAMPIVEERLSQGVELHILFCEERVAGTLFIVFGRTHRFQHLVLTDHDAMVLDARIDPEFRGQGLYAIFLSQSIAWLRRQGIDRLFIDSSEHNDRSVRSFSKVGFRFLLRYRLKRGQYRFDQKPL